MLNGPVRQCRSLSRGLALGVLLTSLVMLLYWLPERPHQRHLQEVQVPYSCEHHPSHEREHPASNTSQNVNDHASHCTPKVDIMFMKTHKTASSTLLNILFRFGEKHQLKFAFPDSRNDFQYPWPFERSLVKDYQPGMCFNIICNHMRFNEAEVAKLIPADSTYITILRDPAHLFESSFHYFGHLVPFTWKIPGKDKLSEFLRDPQRYFEPEGYNSFYLKNLLFFDFGYDNGLHPQDPRVDQAIHSIARRFQLIMLTEHFEESLILLKDTLCWEMEDLLFFKLNTRKTSTVSQLTAEQTARALDWNGIDWRLYRHFNATFWQKVEAYGRGRMALEVQELRRRNQEMAAICIEGGAAVEANSIQEIDMQPWQPMGEKSILGYNLKEGIDERYRAMCRRMLTPEIQYLTEMGVNLWATRLWGRVKDLINW